MKPSVVLPIITAIAGFGAGWLLKPAPGSSGEASTPAPQRPTRETPAPSQIEPPPPEATAEHPAPKTPLRPAPDRQQVDDDIHSQDDAKLARLMEALSLNDAQKEEVLKAVAAAKATLEPEGGIDSAKLLEIAGKAGADLEKAILAMLTPEQVTAFTALRERSLENSVETNAQDQISKLAKLTDLSPEQRQIMLDRARDEVRTEYAERSPGLDLLLDTSPLPTGSAFITGSSLTAMTYLSADADPSKAMEDFRNEQRRNLDAQVEKYKDILTPAQLSRLQLDIDEKKRVLDLLDERLKN